LKLQRGETILIQGGAGGVASFAIQLAKHLGARVITTTSAANHDYVRSLGADEIIDYNATDFTKVVRGCDAVFDTVGGDVAEKSFTVLKPGGRAAFIASGAQAPKPERDDVTSLRPPVGRARRPLERIAQLHQAGAVRPPTIELYRLSEAADAHRVSESRHFRGKLVFQVRCDGMRRTTFCGSTAPDTAGPLCRSFLQSQDTMGSKRLRTWRRCRRPCAARPWLLRVIRHQIFPFARSNAWCSSRVGGRTVRPDVSLYCGLP
jgi:hypothetical protein